jgi:hypothetical protein
VLWLKATNAGFVVLALYATSRAARVSVPEGVSARLAVVVLLGTSPSVLVLSDFTLTDLPFLALAACTLWARASEGPRENWYGEFGVAALVAAALLTRSIGVCLAAAIVADRLLRRRWRAALLHFATATIVALAWTGWASLSRSPRAGPLLDYYLSYEKPALAYLRSDPLLAWNIFSGNLLLARDSVSFLISPVWSAYPLAAPVGVLLALLGVHRLLRDGAWFPLLYGGIDVPALLLHPFAPFRYLIAVLPVFLIAIVAGADAAGTLLLRAVTGRGLLILLAAFPLALGNCRLWLDRVAPSPPRAVGWEGFQETFGWVRAHTPVDARLGAIFDPVYFLYTGRQSVRPWIHHPETYFYPYGNAHPFVGTVAEVARELRRLRIDYLVLDPPRDNFEVAAVRMLRELLALPEVSGSLVFRSSDGKHEIYRLFQMGSAR